MATRRPTGVNAPNGDIWEFQDAKVGDITQTGVTGATVAAQISQLNDDLAITKVSNSFITLESGISITTNQVFKQGNHIFGWITFGFSAQTPDNLKLGTLNAGYKNTNYFVRIAAGLGTEAWACEHTGYVIQETGGALYVKGYINNIKAAHIHLDYVV